MSPEMRSIYRKLLLRQGYTPQEIEAKEIWDALSNVTENVGAELLRRVEEARRKGGKK